MIRNFLKDKFLITKIRNRFNPSVQISQRQLFHYYQDRISKRENVKIADTGFRVFSQFEEDGKLLFLFSAIGMDNKVFVEIGSDDGVNSNSANLYFNFGWHGLFIDGNPKSIKRGRKFYDKYPHPWFYKPKFVCSKVNRENVNKLIEDAGFKGEIGLLSIDVDGNDYWIWDAISVVSPKVVIIETHVEFGLNNIVVPYDPDYSYPGKHPVYHGASPVAMTNLAKRKGYRLVGANELGFNFIFVKNGIADESIPEVSVESVLSHPSVAECYKDFEPIKDWKYLEG
ncbi:hypothetical protein [Sporocytophaga myxococcoides]|uniref:hypothetical protein n=1 Tax=Sporocytophaga myxococcoides TaxID=153721 RepID=UPI0012DEB864|nr:hypothetical protein [Sporocytophaga myxococcoides]